MDGKLEELVADLRRQNQCYQCNCIACGREGMGELHDHICTGEEGCKKTVRKLDARRRSLQMKCVEAANALRSISDAFKAMVGENERLRATMRKMAEGWSNALELDLIPPQHRTSAQVLRDEAYDALKGFRHEG